jgi:hypothetical protein
VIADTGKGTPGRYAVLAPAHAGAGYYEPEIAMAEPNPPRSLKRVWIGMLILIVLVWIIYAVTGGPSTPGPDPQSSPTSQSP